MSPDVRALLEQTGALLTGHFRLSSGLHSGNYVQCAKLLEDPAAAKMVGAQLAGKMRAFNAERIVAPALGGVIIGFTVADALQLPFAFTERKEGQMTLRRGFQLRSGERVAIVEDVVTTGKSTRETADVIRQHGVVVIGFGSIMNRSGKENPFDEPYAALMSLTLDTFDEQQCPQCGAGTPLDAPGSRYSK